MTANDAHGGRGRAVAHGLGIDPDTILDLSASLNPLAPDVPTLLGRLTDAAGWYPDPTDATKVLAAALGTDPERLVLTNGGAEAIALVAALEPVGSIDEPEFSLYRRHLERVDPAAPRWRSNPHNPLGRLADPDERAHVWDEAFYPLATGTWTRGDSSWRIGSLTKLWACPGLRIGYVIAPDDDRANDIRSRQPAWSVSSLALEAIPVLLERTDLGGWAKQLADLRRDLGALLDDHGYVARACDAPWVLVEDAASLARRLLDRGIVTRDCTSFGLPGTIRIAVPGDDGLERIDVALAEGAT